MPARSNIIVGGRASAPAAPAKPDTAENNLRRSLLEKAGNLINEAAALGGDGLYRQAIRRETHAMALLDTVEFIDRARWPEFTEGLGGRAPSEVLAERFNRLSR